MSDNHSFLALDWVKGEIEETLKQARQALEAFVENPEDSAQMRFCLAYLHQVHGTLQIVEFYGAALLAEEMEKLCLALTNGQVARVADGQEVLMRAILQLPPYLERVKASRRDLPVVLLPLLNDLRAVRGEPLLSETALFTPDLGAGERAPIQVSPAAATGIDPVMLKKVRQVYQLALVGFIRNDAVADNLKKMMQVFVRLESLSGASPIRELWQVAAAIVEGLQERSIEAGTAVKMLLGHVDRQLREIGDDPGKRAPTELMKNLLYYVARSTGETTRLKSVKDLYRLQEALPGEALVNEERARMHGPDREAMKSVVDALCEELGRVKDALDLFVRKSDADKNIADLTAQVPVLKQVADTVAVLGLGQPRRILQEQIDAIDRIGTSGMLPQDGTLLDIAGALLYVEATLMGMIAEKPMGGGAKGPAAEFSASEQLLDAQAAVLRESRSALEKAKDAVIEYIASQWNPTHLQSIPELIESVRGSLVMLMLPRPAGVLASAARYVGERLLAGEHRPDWQEMDTLADVITSVEYYLERIANDAQGGEHILDIAERGLGKLGYGPGAAAPEAAVPVAEAAAPVAAVESVSGGEWQVADVAAIEAEMAEAVKPPALEVPVEREEHEVIVPEAAEALAPLSAKAVEGADELKDMQERLHVGDFGEFELDEDATLVTSDLEDVAPAPAADDGLAALEAELGFGSGLEVGAEALTEKLPALEHEEFPSLEAADEFPSLDEAFEVETFGMPEASAVPAEAPHAALEENVFAELEAEFGLEDVPSLEALAEESPVPAAEPVVSRPAEVPPAIEAAVPHEVAEAPVTIHAPAPAAEPAPAAPPAAAPSAAVAAAAAATEPPKKPILPVLTNMPVDDFDFDEEIREIFVEEAEEVMQNINEYFPKWAAHFEDTESLLEFRRGFHTLKGSGRMVGAKVVGELAWAFENMLNKVRDKVLLPDQVMVNLISEVLAVIPGLVEDFWNKSLPRINTSALMAAAEAISRGEKLNAMDVARAAEQAQGVVEAEEAGAAGEGSHDDFDALAASLAPAATPPFAEPAATEVVPEAPAGDVSVGQSAETGMPAFGGDDAILAELAGDQPATFEAEATTENPFAGLDDEWASLELEAAATAPESREEIMSTGPAADFTFEELEAEASLGTAPDDLAREDLSMVEGVEGTPVVTTSEGIEPETLTFADEELVADEAPTAAEPEIDPMLLEIFSGEAEMHLESLRAYLDGIDPDRNQIPIPDEVLRSLHTLKGSAGMAGIAPVAAIAAPLEHLFKDLRNQVGHARREHLGVLRDGHAMISGCIASLNKGESMHTAGADALIARIRQLDQERLAHLEREQAERLDIDTSALTAATAGLVASFMELGIDHVLDAPWELEGWLHGAEAPHHMAVLQDELSRLQHAASQKDVDPLARLCERMAAVYARLVAHTLMPEGEVMNDLASAHEEIVNIFDTLAASQTVGANDALLTRLLDLIETPEPSAPPVPPLSDEPAVVAFQPEEQPSLGELVTAGDQAGWQEPAVLVAQENVDPELLEIFLEEADEVLEAAQEELDSWRRDHGNTPALAALQRHLHTLKGGARLAEIRTLGDLAHELEFLYEGLVDGRYPAAADLVDLLQRCHDRLADMVAELRTTGRCPSGIDLVNAINAYRRDPGAGVHLGGEIAIEPAAAAAPAPAIEAPAEAEVLPAGIHEAVPEVAPAHDVAATPSGDIAIPVSPAAEQQVAGTSGASDNDALFAEFFPQAAAPAPSVAPAVEEPPAVAAMVPAPVAAQAGAAAQDFDPELLEIFLEEAGEIVDATSEQLAEWKRDPNNTLPVQQLQRGLHTLKGGARMAEIRPLGDLAHELETLYERVCDGLMTPTPVLFTLLNRCHDRLAESVDMLRTSNTCPDSDDLVAQIHAYAADPEHFQDVPTAVTLKPVAPAVVEEEAPAAPVEMPPPRAIEAAPVPEHVDADILEIFVEESEELAEGIESSLNEWLENRDATAPMEALLRHLHTLKGGARLAGLKALGDLAHDWETDLVGIQSGAKKADDAFFNGVNARLEAVLAGIKAVRVQAQSLAPAAAPAPEAQAVAPVEMPAETVAPVAPVVEPAGALPAVAAPAMAAAAVPVARSATPPSMLGGFKKGAAAAGPQEMIRVPSDLLEKLLNLAGETSITRSRVEMGVHGFAQTVEEMGSTIQRLADQLRRMDSEMETQIVARHNEETGGKYEDFDPLEMDQYSSLNQLSKALAESASDLLDLKSTLIDKARDTETLLLQQARINTELQEGLMRSRMVPFSRLVPRLKRIVRQTGQEVGKPADLDVINPEGEMDRTLLERIVAPLEHMLRNAVDHGLEDAAGRAAAGKPAQGRVTLTLAREGGEVVLTLADDGRGINIAAVRKKALERGLITEGQDIADQDVIQFIFHAGFSTAAKVTQVSGRGVGMDVVQSEIKQMGGVIAIHSAAGQGTTFVIRLPFTVAVNRALMVRIGEDSYAIPLAQIEGIVRASPYELDTYYGPDAPLFEYAGVTYKLSYLGEFVHGVKSPNLVGQTMPLPVLLIRGGEQRVAIQVDQLIGSREIVVKSVGSQLATVAGISGATILGDGSVVIILDVTAMLRAAAVVQPLIFIGGGAEAALPVPEAKRTRQVMVVDDSVTVRKVTSRLLERHGYEVLLAKDGMDAIAKLEDARPDVMLLDIEMPRMDGFEVATLVRHNPNLENLPIIMITSRTGEKHRERAFQIGVNCYMGKPFQEEQLLETIAELLAASTVK